MITQLAISTALVFAACPAPAVPAPATPVAPIRPAQVIVVPEDYDVPFDARRGDTLNLVMYPDGDVQARCDHAGGTLEYNIHTTISMCLDVDF